MGGERLLHVFLKEKLLGRVRCALFCPTLNFPTARQQQGTTRRLHRLSAASSHLRSTEGSNMETDVEVQLQRSAASCPAARVMFSSEFQTYFKIPRVQERSELPRLFQTDHFVCCQLVCFRIICDLNYEQEDQPPRVTTGRLAFMNG